MNRNGHGMYISLVNIVTLVLLLPFVAIPGLLSVPFHETRLEEPAGIVGLVLLGAGLIWWHVRLWQKHRWAGILPGIFYVILLALFCGLSNAGY